MKNVNRYFAEFSFFIFYLIITFFYAFLVQFNPILPINIAIWALYCFIFQLSKQIKRPSIWNERAIIYLYLVLAFTLSTFVKSIYYVAYFNEMYLLGETSLVPKNFENDLARTIINPEIFVSKIRFYLSWDQISISFGENSSVKFGKIWYNLFRIIEVGGILFSTLIWTKISYRNKVLVFSVLLIN